MVKWLMLVFILLLRISLCAQDSVRVYLIEKDSFVYKIPTKIMCYEKISNSWYEVEGEVDNRPYAIITLEEGSIGVIGKSVFPLVAGYLKKRIKNIEIL